jgi:hypothetical protein
MSIWQVIGAIFQLVLLVMKRSIEEDEAKKKKLVEAENAVKTGISERDPSKITAGFDLVNRTTGM